MPPHPAIDGNYAKEYISAPMSLLSHNHRCKSRGAFEKSWGVGGVTGGVSSPPNISSKACCSSESHFQGISLLSWLLNRMAMVENFFAGHL